MLAVARKLILVSLLSCSVSSALGATYKISDIGSIPAGYDWAGAAGINKSGQVVGYVSSLDGSDVYSYLWSGGQVIG